MLTDDQTLVDDQEVTQVNVSASSGDLGILASHVPSVEELSLIHI